MLLCNTGLAAERPLESELQAGRPESGLPVHRVSKPQWEFGLAGAVLQLPAYPSSAVSTKRSFALPWFVYRSDKVRLQGGAIKLIALENRRVTIDVSLGASLNANSSDTPLRAGMPNLDYLLEFGPKIDVRLWDSAIAERDKGHRSSIRQWGNLSWSTALRAVVSTNFSSVQSRGVVLGSELRFRREGLFGTDTTISMSVGPIWGAEKLMDYLYEVDPEFATNERAAYDARAGYLGTNLFVGLRRRFGHFRAFAGISAALHSGAKNDGSPLFEKNTTTGAVLGLSWTIRQSKKMVAIVED